jgi:drug/metabolite transporter (DMT)-like permease
MTDIPPVGREIGRTGPAASAPAHAAPPQRAKGLRRDNPLLGIGLVVTSTVFFAASDVLAKHLTDSLPAIQVAWIRFLVFCVLIVPAAAMAGRGGNPLATGHPGIQTVRGFAMVGSAILFVSGLPHLPIADATAISFVAPIFITALSMWALREQVGVRRWSASVIGLLGVLMIVRPGSSAFQPSAALPIASAAVWACTVVMTRMMSETERPLTTLAWSALVGFGLLSALVPFQWVAPDNRADRLWPTDSGWLRPSANGS